MRRRFHRVVHVGVQSSSGGACDVCLPVWEETNKQWIAVFVTDQHEIKNKKKSVLQTPRVLVSQNWASRTATSFFLFLRFFCLSPAGKTENQSWILFAVLLCNNHKRPCKRWMCKICRRLMTETPNVLISIFQTWVLNLWMSASTIWNWNTIEDERGKCFHLKHNF